RGSFWFEWNSKRMSEPGSNPDNESGGPPRKPQPPKFRMSRPVMAWTAMVLVAIMVATVVSQSLPAAKEITIDELYKYAEKGDIEEIIISDDRITGEFKPGRPQGRPIKQKMRDFTCAYNTAYHFDTIQERLRTIAPEARITYKQSRQT